MITPSPHKASGVVPIRISQEHLEHLPPLERCFAEYLLGKKDPRIVLIEEVSA
jgi:hypothetical protein